MYGGTKSEMERLLADAEKLSGVHYDINNLSDVYNAIHVIQTEMGITGTTAEEAEHTISGSIGMMKASWSNLLTALGDGNNDISDEMEDFSNSLKLVFENIAPVAKTAIEGTGQLLGELIPELIEKVPGFLAEYVPLLAETVMNMFRNIFSSVSGSDMTAEIVNLIETFAGKVEEGIPILAEKALPMILGFTESLRENIGHIVDAGLDLVLNLAKGFADALPTIIEYAPKIISNIAGIINDNMPKILETGVKIVVTLVKGLIQAIPTIIQNLPAIIKAIVDVFMAFNWLSLGKSVITMIGDGIKALFTHLPTLLKDIGKNAVEWLKAINWATLGRDIIDLILIGIEALMYAIPNALVKIGKLAVQGFKKIDWLSLGKNIVLGIIKGIGALGGKLIKAIVDLGKKALDGIKDFFGINSPSRVFRDQVGKMMAEGMAIGFEKGIPVAGMKRSLQDALDSMKDVEYPELDGIGKDLFDIVNPEDMEFDEVVTRLTTDDDKEKVYPSDNITFNIYAREGQDEKRIAEETMKLFTRWDNQRRRAFA